MKTVKIKKLESLANRRYRVEQEYLAEWLGGCSPSEYEEDSEGLVVIISRRMMARLAYEWQKPINELLKTTYAV